MTGRDRTPLNRLVGAFVNPVVESVDLDDVLGEIDLDELIDRVDLNRALDRVDIDRLLSRVDVDRLLARIDVDAFMNRVDVDAILKRTAIGNVVTDSAGTMAASAIDLSRSALVGVDALAGHVGDKLMRREVSSVSRDASQTARPAGAGTRLAAYALDLVVIGFAFSATVSVIFYLINLFVSKQVDQSSVGGVWWAALSLLFTFWYLWGAWAIIGRTVGQGLLGLRVVNSERGRLHAVPALIRVVVFPVSFIFGLGFVGLVFSRRRRALHDVAAHSLVVYDWGKRTARMPPGIQKWASGGQPTSA